MNFKGTHTLVAHIGLVCFFSTRCIESKRVIFKLTLSESKIKRGKYTFQPLIVFIYKTWKLQNWFQDVWFLLFGFYTKQMVSYKDPKYPTIEYVCGQFDKFIFTRNTPTLCPKTNKTEWFRVGVCLSYYLFLEMQNFILCFFRQDVAFHSLFFFRIVSGQSIQSFRCRFKQSLKTEIQSCPKINSNILYNTKESQKCPDFIFRNRVICTGTTVQLYYTLNVMLLPLLGPT